MGCHKFWNRQLATFVTHLVGMKSPPCVVEESLLLSNHRNAVLHKHRSCHDATRAGVQLRRNPWRGCPLTCIVHSSPNVCLIICVPAVFLQPATCVSISATPFLLPGYCNKKSSIRTYIHIYIKTCGSGIDHCSDQQITDHYKPSLGSRVTFQKMRRKLKVLEFTLSN